MYTKLPCFLDLILSIIYQLQHHHGTMVAPNVASSALETSDMAMGTVRVDSIQFLATWGCLNLSVYLPPTPHLQPQQQWESGSSGNLQQIQMQMQIISLDNIMVDCGLGSRTVSDRNTWFGCHQAVSVPSLRNGTVCITNTSSLHFSLQTSVFCCFYPPTKATQTLC